MKNLIIMAAALCCSFQMAAAQRVERADSKEIGAARQEMMRDIARITIPGKSVSNIIYMINNHTTLWDFENSTAGIVLGQMLYNPTITIESDALNDPAAIDPISHHPMNGSFTTSGNGTKSISE